MAIYAVWLKWDKWKEIGKYGIFDSNREMFNKSVKAWQYRYGWQNVQVVCVELR